MSPANAGEVVCVYPTLGTLYRHERCPVEDKPVVLLKRPMKLKYLKFCGRLESLLHATGGQLCDALRDREGCNSSSAVICLLSSRCRCCVKVDCVLF